ncbi:MAG: transcriptional activator RfaH [Maritimibacter sp.]
MDNERDETWVLAQLKPNAARIARLQLKRQGFDSFLPLVEETRRQRARFVPCLKPLFPGYIFIALNGAPSPWTTLNNTQGISRLVTFGASQNASPSRVPTTLVNELKARCDGAGVLKPCPVKPGDTVRLNTGPFAEFVGKVEAIDAKKRAFVLLDLMSGPMRLRAPSDAMRLA